MGNEDCNSTIHGTGSPYFLKIMLADFAQKLRIPPLFVPRLIKENSENMILQGPGARQWTVKLWGNSTRLEFRQGWKFFVQDHTVEAGDILVFKYISESYFKVRIFGRNGCEKNIINFGKSDKRCGDTSPASQLPVALDCEEEMNGDHTEAAAQKGKKLKSFSDDHLPKDPKHFQPSFAENEHDTRKSAKAEQTSCGKLKLHYVSGRRPATEIERNKALEAANTFTSDKPFCLMVLKPSHLYKGHWLNFPRGYEDRLKLPKERREVVLLDPNNNEWHVQYVWSSRNIGALSSGWKSFSLVNNLEVGDICIFERADEGKINIKLRVHIFRVAIKYGPHKRVEGRGMDDCLPLPLNHSNKKMKVGREDLPINLTAKSSDPEEGKIAKQVQEKKEKASTESNYLKMKKLKSFCDDHLPKDPKHFQPSFVRNEHDTRKSAEAEQTNFGKLKLHYVSGRRPATEIERNKALEAANTFTSDKPFCLIVLKPSHLYKGHWLNFPRGYEDRLKLPKERREVVLLDPNSNEWHVQYVWSSRNIGALSSGWKSFSFVNNLEVGDICIFERADEGKINIKLRVHIFRVAMKYGPHKRVEGRGMDDCLSLPLNHSNKKMKVGREDLPINLTAKSSDPEEGKIAKQVQEKKEKASTESNYLKMKKLKSFSDDHLPKDPKHFQPSFVGNEHDTRKYAEAEQTNFGKLKLHYVSGRRPATEIERNKALEAANTFTSDKPFCLIVLKPSHLYKGHWLNFPRGYEDRLKLPKERREVVLLDPNSNEWHVQYVWSSRNIGALSSGWKSFSLVNNLEVGDICIFERADEGKINIKLRVHIFRVAMKYGPHKRVEGRGMDDCLPLPLNHSNKKMKVGREDLPINLTAKSSDPEEGKIAKQVQEKKEKASTYLKMDKSKCTLSPWERKTACRSSLRLAMKCNPVKSSKKELLSLCPSSSEEGQKAIGRDTMVPDPDVSVKEEVLMNISESNDEPHAMPPRSGQLHPSQGPLPEVPLMTNSMCFQMNLEGEASSLGVALSPEEAIFVVDISSSDTEN